jgi:AraC-like DNA-binding protein
VTVSGDDPAEARRVYRAAFGGAPLEVEPVDEGLWFRAAAVGDERVTLRASTLTGRLTGTVPHLREYVVSWLQSGSGELRRRQQPAASAVVSPFLLPFEQEFSIDFGPHRQNLVHFQSAFLEDVATEFHGGMPQLVSFDLDARPGPAKTAEWRQAVVAATAAHLRAEDAPLVRSAAQRSLARALLQLFPWHALDAPAALREPSMTRTRLALEFLQHHAHLPVTPAEAARAAGLHTRSLQQQTRRHLGVSPSAYLRDVRLERARTQLTEEYPGSATVAGIARAWGFGHLGRFSASYRARFGERPRDTLRRGA